MDPDRAADPTAALAGARLRPPDPWPAKRWLPVARDRVGELTAITCLQRSGRDRFFSMTSIYTRHAGGWEELVANGHEWPLAPTSPRPSGGRPIAMLGGGGRSGVGDGSATATFVAGVLASEVRALRASSAHESHLVEIDEPSGIFVALTVHDQDPAYQLIALAADGREIDRYVYAEQ